MKNCKPQPPPERAAQLAAMDKAALKKLLANIEKAKEPKPKMGAMCYERAAPPNRMEYVCPACGEKTLYARDVSWTWTYELETCRHLFKEISKRETMVLDESSFCKKCRPDTNAPSLGLVIRYSDGTTSRTPSINSDDLRLLKAFLSGDLAVKDAEDSETPIKQHLPRLRQLLGIKDE